MSVLRSALLLALLGAAPAAPRAATADPATALAPVLAQMQTAAVVRGRFTQTRQLHDLPQPLRSSGEFVFARDRGIRWHTEQPFDSEFVLTPAAMVLADEGGEATRLDATQQPGLRLASQLFMALFALDLDTLRAHFTVAAASAPAGWALTLTPKDAVLAVIASAVQVRGDRQIDEVELVDGRGDRTQIRFSAVSGSNEPLPADDARRFGP